MSLDREDRNRRFRALPGLKETLVAAGVWGMASFPPPSHAQSPEPSVVEQLEQQLRGKSFRQGAAQMVTWAAEKKYEILGVYIEPVRARHEGRWIDLRGGGLADVNPPNIGKNTKLWKALTRYSKEKTTNNLRLCMQHTHTDEYLQWIKSGRLPKEDVELLQRLGVIERVSRSQDARGYTDAFDANGPFATPPGSKDIRGSKPYQDELKQFAEENGVTLEVYESVANELGLWYWRDMPDLGEAGTWPGDTTEEGPSFTQLQVKWALFANKLKGPLTSEDFLERPEHQEVIEGYARLGVEAVFVPKEHIAELTSCAAGLEKN